MVPLEYINLHAQCINIVRIKMLIKSHWLDLKQNAKLSHVAKFKQNMYS